MKTVRCACGTIILVTPDVKEMALTIQNHAKKHWNSCAVAEDLAKQVLEAVSEI